MQPLDLTARPPRPCREALGGITFLPRAIDKVRGELPGGAPGAYFTTLDRQELLTLSGLFYRTLRITSDDFTRSVANADDEAAVLAWLLKRVDGNQISKWNNRLFSIYLADVGPKEFLLMRSRYSALDNFSLDTLLIDAIDRDDIESFAI